MTRKQRRETRKTRAARAEQKNAVLLNGEVPIVKRATKPLTPKTEQQKRYINAIRNFQLTFGIGAAGTGKTYIAGSLACEMLENPDNDIEKIIITRPAVESGESLGFLPGELEEKYEPYLAAFRDVLNERLGKTYVNYLIKTGKIEAIPFAYMRGRTFKRCVVILDEAQNASREQMKLFLTRIGESCKVIIDGDESQSDIENSGLLDAIERISYIPTVKVIRFTHRDVIRSDLVGEIIEAYQNPRQKEGGER